MSDASLFSDMARGRNLTEAEYNLLKLLLRHRYSEDSLNKYLSNSRVVDMKDGGMGSIRFIRNEQRRYGKTIAEADYIDSDGVLVSITVNLDKHGDLFELDFWKVDFSALKRYPQPSEVSVKARG